MGESVGWRSYAAQVIAEDDERILIRLHEPFTYRGHQREYFVAAARHQGDTVAQLARGKPLFANISHIESSGINHGDLLDEKNWKVGIAMIGELEPLDSATR